MLTTTLLTTLTLALTLPTTTLSAPSNTRPDTLSATSIIALDPTTSNCADAPAEGECRTALSAAPYIGLSFHNFDIPTFGAQAALLSLMLFETAGFKYSKNHFPGRPGQGTRNMQMYKFNLQYANWLAKNCKNCGISAEDVEAAEKESKDAVLALVDSDQWGFSSAAWYLDTQCDASIKEGLAREDETGSEAYLTECVGTEVTERRTVIWKKAIELGHW